MLDFMYVFNNGCLNGIITWYYYKKNEENVP